MAVDWQGNGRSEGKLTCMLHGNLGSELIAWGESLVRH